MKRQSISSGSPFEKSVGFSRAVRVGNILAIAGTAPIAPGGGPAAPGDLYGQTKRCIEIAATAIEEAGYSLDSVIRTRMMLTDISRWEEAARAHGEAFGDIRPVSTMVEISALIDPAWLVEMEFDCVVPDAQGSA